MLGVVCFDVTIGGFSFLHGNWFNLPANNISFPGLYLSV